MQKICFKFQFYWMCSPIEMDLDLKVSFVWKNLWLFLFLKDDVRYETNLKCGWILQLFNYLFLLEAIFEEEEADRNAIIFVTNPFGLIPNTSSFPPFKFEPFWAQIEKKWNKQWRSMHVVGPNIKMNQEKILDNYV